MLALVNAELSQTISRSAVGYIEIESIKEVKNSFLLSSENGTLQSEFSVFFDFQFYLIEMVKLTHMPSHLGGKAT